MAELAHIVLVEDSRDDYEATMRSLKKNHFINPVQWCKTGQQALHYIFGEGEYFGNCDVQRPDLVLLDLNMPGIDGRVVLERIKNDPDKKSIPVIVLTTSAYDRDVALCYKLGASTYIQKPVSFEGLADAIRTMKDYWFGLALLPKP